MYPDILSTHNYFNEQCIFLLQTCPVWLLSVIVPDVGLCRDVQLSNLISVLFAHVMICDKMAWQASVGTFTIAILLFIFVLQKIKTCWKCYPPLPCGTIFCIVMYSTQAYVCDIFVTHAVCIWWIYIYTCMYSLTFDVCM